MSHKRMWEIGAAVAWLATLGTTASGWAFWRQEQRSLNAQLAQALDGQDLSRVETLLEKGASVHTAGNRYGMTPLMLASFRGRNDLVTWLLSRGADLNDSPETGGAALMCAAGGGQDETVNLLLSRGANVNWRAPGGPTAVLLAVAKREIDTVDLLIANGADVNIQAEFLRDCVRRTWTPLQLAVEAGDTEMIRLLKDAGAKK